jgi:hypothetical protein
MVEALVIAAVMAAGLAVAAAAAGRIVADPSCPKCGHRAWSKGVPHWRCRRCGTNYRPADAVIRAYVLLFLLRALWRRMPLPGALLR